MYPPVWVYLPSFFPPFPILVRGVKMTCAIH